MTEIMSRETLKRKSGFWALRENRDAFGHPLVTELQEFYHLPGTIEQETAMLPLYYRIGGYYARSVNAAPDCAGAIPNILDFSRILCFAVSEQGFPFCLDYRDPAEPPSVIFWDRACWRRIAPDFESFLDLFDLDAAAASPPM
jgi:hypothetical protein